MWTSISYTRTANSLSLVIASTGSYPQFPSQRNYIIRLRSCYPATSASVNDQTLRASRFGGPNTFRWSVGRN